MLIGPPGTGKSLIIDTLCKVFDVDYFDYLLTKFTTPKEIFGSVNVKKLKEKGLVTYITDNKLPEAKIAFLDEVFKSSSAILNTLLTIINERKFVNGNRTQKVPLWSLFGASNELPEKGLEAIYDRFLFRVWSDYLRPDNWDGYLDKYWDLHLPDADKSLPEFDFGIIEDAHEKVWEVNLYPVKEKLLKLFQKLREHGIEVSDRRKGRSMIAVASSAVLDGRDTVTDRDLLVLRFVLPNTEDEYALVRQTIIEMAGKEEKAYQELTELKPQLISLRDNADTEEVMNNLDMLKNIKRKITDAKDSYSNHGKIAEICDELTAIFDEINQKLII